MTQKYIKQNLLGSNSVRLVAYARRQILKENPSISPEELEKLLQDEDSVTAYAKRFIMADLDDFIAQINEIENEKNPKIRVKKSENLVFDFRTRIPDIRILLKAEGKE